jgi:ketosteroid isomerase-like protein
MSTHVEIAARLFGAIEAGDIEAVRQLYAPHCVVWHNNDGHEQPAEDNLRVLGWVVRNLRELRYEDVRRHETPTGFVQQHVLRAVGPGGQPVAIAACLVGRVENGRITRLDEYLDSAQLVPLTSHASRA